MLARAAGAPRRSVGTAMADQEANAVVTDAEIEAALAEAESEAEIPNLDDEPATVVTVPVQPDVQSVPVVRARQASDARVVATTSTPAGTPGGAADEEPISKASSGPAWAHWVISAVDAVLSAMNRPFGWMGPEARRLTALVATVTIIMSLLAMYLLPALLPNHHPITDLREQSLKTQAPPAEEVPATD